MKAEFIASGLGRGFWTDLSVIVSSALFAPVFEELAYRGVMLRSLHDSLLRYTKRPKSLLSLASIVAVTLTAIAFILPHVTDLKIGVFTIAYFLTSAGFSFVFLITGSMLAAMISHSLQSMVAFSNLLIYGAGDYALSPVIKLIVFAGPILVYLIGKLIQQVLFRKRTAYQE